MLPERGAGHDRSGAGWRSGVWRCSSTGSRFRSSSRLLARPLGLGPRYVPFIVARNWAAVIVGGDRRRRAALHLLGLLAVDRGADIDLALSRIASRSASAYVLARTTLVVSVRRVAVPIVVLDFLLSLVVGSVWSTGCRRAWIVDPHQIEPLRRRDRPGGGAVARVERRFQIVRAPLSLADQLQRADHRAHLVVQEGARRGLDDDLVAARHDVEPVERPDRALRLALGGAERREVVRAEQSACAARCMATASSGRADMPDAAAVERPAARGG